MRHKFGIVAQNIEEREPAEFLERGPLGRTVAVEILLSLLGRQFHDGDAGHLRGHRIVGGAIHRRAVFLVPFGLELQRRQQALPEHMPRHVALRAVERMQGYGGQELRRDENGENDDRHRRRARLPPIAERPQRTAAPQCQRSGDQPEGRQRQHGPNDRRPDLQGKSENRRLHGDDNIVERTEPVTRPRPHDNHVQQRNGSDGAEESRILQINAGTAEKRAGTEEIHEVGADDHIKRQHHRDDGGHGADAAPVTDAVKHQRCRHDDEVKVGQRRDIHPKNPERQVIIGAEPDVFSGKADEVDVVALGVGRRRRRQIDGLRLQQCELQQFRIAKIVGIPHAGRHFRLAGEAAPHERGKEPLVDGSAADAEPQFCQRGADAVKFAAPSLLRQGADEVLFK